LPESTRRVSQSKALLAILFAGSVLNSQLPAPAEDKGESKESVINRITNQTQLSPEGRAYYLLRIAEGYLQGDDRAAVENLYASLLNQPSALGIGRSSTKFYDCLPTWADRASLAERSTSGSNTETKSGTRSKPTNSALAASAIQAALKQLDMASDPFAKLNFYFIASILFKKTGNVDGIRKCNSYLAETFQSCESGTTTDERVIKAASSVLNSMAYGIVPIEIGYSPTNSKKPGKVFTEDDFNASEKLKLRALAIVDGLARTDQVRRLAHRDLVLWYKEFGKEELAEKQMQVLFGLVGCTDKSILYPKAGACGHLVWWTPETPSTSKVARAMVKCGMG